MSAVLHPVPREPNVATDWLDANQRYLVSELGRLKSSLGGQPASDAKASDKAHAALPAPAAVDSLTDAFSLSPFERDVLLLCAGVEMDADFARQCAEAQGNMQRPWATFGLALGALDAPHWSAITPAAPLRRWRLIEVEEAAALVSARLRIDERILHFLAGINDLDSRLQPLLRRIVPASIIADSHRRLSETIAENLQSRDGAAPLIQLMGDDTSGAEQVAARTAAASGYQLHGVRFDELPATAAELDALATLWSRETVLLPAALFIRGGTQTPPAATLRFLEGLYGLIFVASREPIRLDRPSLRYEVNLPGAAEQMKLWQQMLVADDTPEEGELEAISGQFRLSAGAIAALGKEHRDLARDASAESLWDACRTLGRPRLDDLAQRIAPAAEWDDLVLPESQKRVLREIASEVRHRLTVYETWGFARVSLRGLGISALFTGESGTGKTMAAEVLANELRLDLYRIDLSAVVSKYIGETEKNLRRVFDAAEEGGAILLFDEADALFGKRSEVKDSHDRYANIEVSYLLQRMEAYRGLAVLTTNLKSALDPAFQRRLRFIVQFPFPDAKQREAIWRRAFPRATPTAELNYGALSQLHIAGGGIRNMALKAAFLAADGGEAVSMAHLLRAAQSESVKFERPLNDAETRGWI